MPLSNEVINRYLNPVFVETGLENGMAVFIAGAAGFKTIHSIEASEHYLEIVRGDPRFKAMTNVTLHKGDSAKILAGVIESIDEPITFWLDAHPFNEPMQLKDCPLRQELEVIAKTCKHVPTVMIDDWRVFSDQDKSIIMGLLKAVPGIAVITFEPGQVPDDIVVGQAENSTC